MSRAHPPLRRSSMRAVPWRVNRSDAAGHRPRHRNPSDARPLMLRRLLLLGLVLLGAWIGTHAMATVLPNKGTAPAEIALLVLFGILFGWISAGFWTGVFGAVVLMHGNGDGPLEHGAGKARLLPLDADARTAIVMPICNEDVATVFGGLTATIDSLRATGEAANFDVYVLSDTNDPAVRAAEHAAYGDLAERLSDAPGDETASLRIHYRWRQRRTKRKAGNVADFCRRWGGAYRYFVVLDADSVMTGECLTSLVRLMESNPDAGIIQTAPAAVGHDTLHARVQQFCARAYGPLFTAGMRFWQCGESHYWGHNAILRMAPFIEHCALAPIDGKGSLAGEILSHDFVEAALMRRAGWKVWVADRLEGSYEQVPPNLLAELQRDRRWCQGNLQNAQLMFEPGLHAVHRAAFATGALSYASSPLWLAFLLLSTFLFAQQAGTTPAYFFEPYQLFPTWPTVNFKLMVTLFGLTAVLLLAPKVLSLIGIVLRGEARRFGGKRRLLASALLEFVHSMLLAPVRMLFHTQFVLTALTGWRLDWKSPPRNDDATPWREAIGRHGLHTALAVLWIVAIVASSQAFAWWLTPILLGLLGAIPLSVWSSRVAGGIALRRRGLLLTPEEVRMPRVLRKARRVSEIVAQRNLALRESIIDADAGRRLVAALPERSAASGAKAAAEGLLVDRAIGDGPDALSATDWQRLLSSAVALARLQAEVLAHRAHPGWWADTVEPPLDRALPAGALTGERAFG